MKTTIAVQNLKCGGCVNTITSKLLEIKNIQNVQVDKESSSVTFNYLNLEDALKVKKTLRKIGYPVVDEKNSLFAKANSFVSCSTGKFKS